MMQEILVYVDIWVDYFPDVGLDIVTFDVGGEIPLAKTAANTAYFVNK